MHLCHDFSPWKQHFYGLTTGSFRQLKRISWYWKLFLLLNSTWPHAQHNSGHMPGSNCFDVSKCYFIFSFYYFQLKILGESQKTRGNVLLVRTWKQLLSHVTEVSAAQHRLTDWSGLQLSATGHRSLQLHPEPCALSFNSHSLRGKGPQPVLWLRSLLPTVAPNGH